MRPLATLVLCFALTLPAGVAGANFRLSQGEIWSDVYTSSGHEDVVVTPDGQWVFYRADADTDDAVELWRVPAAGGTPERISGLLPSGSNVFGLRITPDGARVLFYSPQDDVAVGELFSAPVGAPPGSYVKVNAPPPAGFNVSFRGAISPDSHRLLYASSPMALPATDAARLWVAEIDGSAQTPLVTLPLDRSFDNFGATPDFGRAIYIADSQVAGRPELWSVPIAGGAPVKLNGALVAGGGVHALLISPLDGTVVYLADQQVDQRNELYAVPAAGGGVLKLNGTLAAGHSLLSAAFTPDGSRVLYVEIAQGTGEIVELWSVTPNGTGRVALLGAMVAGGHLAALDFDATHLVFVADKLVDEKYELFSVPLAGGAVVKLNPSLPANGDVAFDENAWPRLTPDGQRVLYAADQTLDGLENLYSVPVGGGAATVVGTAAAFGLANLRGFELSGGGDQVAMVRYLDPLLPGGTPRVQLWTASLAGGRWLRVDSCPESGEVWHYPTFSPVDSRTIFYTADQEVDGKWELFAGDGCVFCDGLESGSSAHWSASTP